MLHRIYVSVLSTLILLATTSLGFFAQAPSISSKRQYLFARGGAFSTTDSAPHPTPNPNLNPNPIPDPYPNPSLSDLLASEDNRQRNTLNLIASENYASQNVRSILSSRTTNKYSEGLPGARYYAGNAFIDVIESLTIAKALHLYALDPEKWGVNVQIYSGSPANFAVFHALCAPQDRIMGLDLPSGGHLTHGFQRTLKSGKVSKVSATSVHFQSRPYFVDEQTGRIDYDQMREIAIEFKPKIIIAGPGSAYPRDVDYAFFRRVADEVGGELWRGGKLMSSHRPCF